MRARFLIARAGLTERELRIPHPFSFAKLADLVSHDLGRLLKKSNSAVARSRPVMLCTESEQSSPPFIIPVERGKELRRELAGLIYCPQTSVSFILFFIRLRPTSPAADDGRDARVCVGCSL